MKGTIKGRGVCQFVSVKPRVRVKRHGTTTRTHTLRREYAGFAVDCAERSVWSEMLRARADASVAGAGFAQVPSISTTDTAHYNETFMGGQC
eukprot:3046079-Rhodomonas_salina.1